MSPLQISWSHEEDPMVAREDTNRGGLLLFFNWKKLLDEVKSHLDWSNMTLTASAPMDCDESVAHREAKERAGEGKNDGRLQT